MGQQGFHNFLGDTSVIPANVADEIRALPGVDRADPVTARFAVLDLHGSKQFTFVIAAQQNGIGGPWELSDGRHVRADDEVVIDRTLAGQHDIAVGDRITVTGSPLTVVGLSDETWSWMSSFVFISPRAAETMFRSAGQASYVLVRADDPVAAAAVIERRTGLTALPAARSSGWPSISDMATDPVCGMAVTREDAAHFRHNGETFSFCSPGCREEFVTDPDHFIDRQRGAAEYRP